MAARRVAVTVARRRTSLSARGYGNLGGRPFAAVRAQTGAPESADFARSRTHRLGALDVREVRIPVYYEGPR
jgi:hypothetical protein